MTRSFNTAGPVNPKLHYCLDPLARVDVEAMLPLIHQQKYFIIHAPRQTGKTSSLLALMHYLNQQGSYHALYVNFEVGQSARENVSEGILSILQQMALRADHYLKDPFLKELIHKGWVRNMSGHSAFNNAISQWASRLDKPLVLLIDEIDSLIGDTLITILRQLRAGYDMRPEAFPQSVILCGVRDVRDYRIHSSQHDQIISGGSCFNIKAESIRLGDFSMQEIYDLYQQHTEETGQRFEEPVFPQVWEYTEGQPWLVNALAYQVCFRDDQGKDRSCPITVEMMAQAKENLILRRETHIDQLADKLQDPRVRGIIQPILSGSLAQQELPNDDLIYASDLGLIKIEGNIRIANQIYREVIPRELTYVTQRTITHDSRFYLDSEGKINSSALMEAFQQFFRENSESWIERFDYKEAGPQLLLQAFLQRIVNSGGRVNREYALGRGRTDLLVIWNYPGGIQNIVIECKVTHKGRKAAIEEGLEQTARYMDQCKAADGHLVLFDREPARAWEEKIFHETQSYQGRVIQIWGM